MRSMLSNDAQFAPADVTDEAAVTEAVAAATAESSLRIVVNCAGIGNAIKTVGKNGPFPLADFEKIIKVNLAAPSTPSGSPRTRCKRTSRSTANAG